jgi:hypothetical protein
MKFVSGKNNNWIRYCATGLQEFFSVEPKSGFSQTVLVEILEAGELKASNGAGKVETYFLFHLIHLCRVWYYLTFIKCFCLSTYAHCEHATNLAKFWVPLFIVIFFAGLPDPIVEVTLGTHKERTKSKTKTLNPIWANEVQRIPIVNWALPNLLTLRVISKRNIGQRELGYVS